MGTEFIKDMRELIAGWEAKHQTTLEQWEQLRDALDDLKQKIQFGNASIREYMKLHNIEPSISKDIESINSNGKSYPEMLRDIAQKNNGILNVSDAVDILYKEKVGFDRKAIGHNISNTLGRKCEHFIRIKRGQYQYTNGFHKEDVNPKTTKAKQRVKTGIELVVKDMKDKNPQMTKEQVFNRLLEMGFDFQGKKPTNSVNMAWVKLGYHKENKQQSLPGVN